MQSMYSTRGILQTWSFAVLLLPVCASGCGSEVLDGSESASRADALRATDAGSLESETAPVDARVVAQRQQRVRDFFANSRAQRNVVATTRLSTGQILDWIPRPSGVTPPADPPIAPLQQGEERVRIPLEDEPEARGPEGTVPIPVFDVESYLAQVGDHVPDDPRDIATHPVHPPNPTSAGYYYSEWGISQSTTSFIGLNGVINIWDSPDLVTGDHIVSQNVVTRGTSSGRQTVESGAIQDNCCNGGAPYLFVYYTTNNYASEGDWVGGYDAFQKGWCQYSATVYPGLPLSSSTPGGTQIVMTVSTEKSADGWWVYAINQWIGYYPNYKNTDCSATPSTYLFSSTGLRTEASDMRFYGEVYDDAAPNGTNTDMGSGQGWSAGYGYAAYFSNILGKHTTSWTGFNSLTGTRFTTVTDANCYTMQTPQSNNSFYYGGEGAEWAYCD